jgi:glycosyltransferase involved in cell wall biosynthesis
MRRADAIVTVADVLREETILTFGVAPGRVVTIPNAVDPARLRATRSRATVRAEFGIRTDTPLVASVGALSPEKDPLTHVEVVRRARRLVPDTVHLVIGDGPLRPRLDAAASANGRRLIIAGSRPDVADLLAATDLVLLASRSEGLPGCVIEAGMLGVPTAAFAVGGVPDAVVDGVTGVLVPPGHRGALAAGVGRLLLDRDRLDAMGAGARDHCRARFQIRSAADHYRGLYEAVAR